MMPARHRRMKIEFSELDPKAIYFAMIQCIIPRPIAWILSDSGNESFNLAPFSYFNGVCSRPPIVSVSIGRKRDGERKDTWRNIEERCHYVTHVPQFSDAGAVSAFASPLGFGVSEVTAGNHELVEESGWPLPRLKAASIALLCKHHQTVEIGDPSEGLILGEIVSAFVNDAMVSSDAETGGIRIDAGRLDPLARLGGNDYGGLGEITTVRFGS